MSRAALILDTNILWNLDLCKRLTARIEIGDLEVFIPTLVHAERIRQIANHYDSDFAVDVVRQFVADARFDLLPLTAEHAETVAEVWLQLPEHEKTDNYWHAHRFDIVLCAIALSTGYVLMTEDSGSHLAVVADRMSIAELETWLSNTQ